MTIIESTLAKARKLAALADPASGATDGERANAERMLRTAAESLQSMTELETFRLTVLPVIRLAELALREPDNAALRGEAMAELTAQRKALQAQMGLTQPEGLPITHNKF